LYIYIFLTNILFFLEILNKAYLVSYQQNIQKLNHSFNELHSYSLNHIIFLFLSWYQV